MWSLSPLLNSALEPEKGPRQRVNERVWLCPNATLFVDTEISALVLCHEIPFFKFSFYDHVKITLSLRTVKKKSSGWIGCEDFGLNDKIMIETSDKFE